MNAIHVIEPGLESTVQDLGRFGYAQLGVSASGAADALALRAGNLLVGNAENAAALEMTLTGATLVFEGDAVIAVTGSDFGADLPLWSAVEMKTGSVARFGATRSGARCYVAVRGGLAVGKVLGSASMHVASGLGGRPLAKGAILPIGNEAIRRARSVRAAQPPAEGPLRVTRGPQADWFGDELYGAPYTVTASWNRMGVRLHGPPVPSPAGHMLTEGVGLGAVQIPPNGQPIILFVEHQTTGGYPKPASVISADLWRVGQLVPRREVRFELVSLEAARELLRRQEEWLYSLV
ncbi:MAG TPA: biotin-dependent carboxyltransferase family protein [Bryobacteraceae bacterium]|nr:biotin-dependent carboxyltransferase family protein [Bryobacteraceae bacterium]